MQDNSQSGQKGQSSQAGEFPPADPGTMSESQKLESRFVAWKAGELTDYEVEQLKVSLDGVSDPRAEKNLSEMGRVWELLNHGFQYLVSRFRVDDRCRDQILKAVSTPESRPAGSGLKSGLFSKVVFKAGPWIGGALAAALTVLFLVNTRIQDSARTTASSPDVEMKMARISDESESIQWGVVNGGAQSSESLFDFDFEANSDQTSTEYDSYNSTSPQQAAERFRQSDQQKKFFAIPAPPDNSVPILNEPGLPMLGRTFSSRPQSGSQTMSVPSARESGREVEDRLRRSRSRSPGRRAGSRAGLAGDGAHDFTNGISHFDSEASLNKSLKQYKAEDTDLGFRILDRRSEAAKKMPSGETSVDGWFKNNMGDALGADDSDFTSWDTGITSGQDSGIDFSEPVSNFFGVDKINARFEKSVTDNETSEMRVLTESSPHPELDTAASPMSTFAMNVSDVSFRLAWQSVLSGAIPDPAAIRSEEFINAMNYRDPLPPESSRIGITSERARWPFQTDREILRVGINTSTIGQDRTRGMNLVILLDTSGSMERMDRSRSVDAILDVISNELAPADRLSLVGFAAVPTLWIDGLPGGDAQRLLGEYANVTPSGGTNLEAALNLAYEKLFEYFISGGENRILLLTDGAANMGEIRGGTLGELVDNNRRRGAVLDCFGIGWDGYDDALLEALSRNGDGRYGFISSPDEATEYFLNTWLKSLEVLARDVKAQIEFNPSRVTRYRQVGYQSRRLTAEQFRDNTVDAGEMAGAESGQAVYIIQVDDQGVGPIGWARVRFFDAIIGDYTEEMRVIEYLGSAQPVVESGPSIMLAASSASLAEYLGNNPYAQDVDLGVIEDWILRVVPAYEPDPGPAMIRDMVRFCRTQSASPFK